ncbi:adipocyte plasma membrane-associated protein [Gouania willdenowi]|uniref:Adipocyte plasma membrane-associated protein n=1 Tax=Gouania willdenowi TaxID=441366 RepID=A0A8C5H869_GOUWI|nr:adipocyte plasma membrane-associated protein [Gouania willdenowi]
MNQSGLRYRRLPQPQVITDELPETRDKRTGTYSAKVFQVTLVSLGGFFLLPLLVVVLLFDSPVQPEVFSLKEPPEMKGCWEPNLVLRQADRLYQDQILGPESITNIGDVLYSGTADGRIVKMIGRRVHTVTRLGRAPCGSVEEEPSCGRPLGIRAGLNGTLFVADAYLGLFMVNPSTGEATRLVEGGQLINGRKLLFINDLAVTQNGRKVFFTSSSSRWQRRNYLQLIMEATADGRVLELDVDTREVSVVMDNLRFPNGIQLLPDEESVLVAETTMARIRRVHVAGLNKGGMDTFVENLPGFPDNVRPSSSGGYWVAMSAIRPNPGFSVLDFLSQRAWIKKLIFKLFSPDLLIKFIPSYSLVAEIHDGGVCSRSFHDPNGLKVAHVSEVHEFNGHLYLGSFRSPYVCRLDLSQV